MLRPMPIVPHARTTRSALWRLALVTCCHAPNGSPSTYSIGFAWVHLGHILTAMGPNVRRLGEWLRQTAPVKTRVKLFVRLMTAPIAA
jgi:hypothetical protein